MSSGGQSPRTKHRFNQRDIVFVPDSDCPLPIPPQVSNLALENSHQAFNDILVPVLSLAVDHSAQLGNGNADANIFKAAHEFGDGPDIPFGHQDTDSPNDLPPRL